MSPFLIISEESVPDIKNNFLFTCDMTTNTRIPNNETTSGNSTENTLITSFKPNVLHYWFMCSLFALSLFLAFTVYNSHTIVKLSLILVSGLMFIYSMLSVCTTRYLITLKGILINKYPFSKKFKEIHYCDINNIIIRQGAMQKRFKIGNIIISTERVNYIFKGIKHPQKIKELINKEKCSDYERRTLLRKIL